MLYDSLKEVVVAEVAMGQPVAVVVLVVAQAVVVEVGEEVVAVLAKMMRMRLGEDSRSGTLRIEVVMLRS